MQCQAKSKQSGQQCKRHATPGKKVCVIHGGRSLAGANSPTFKDGSKSKYYPKRLLEVYEDVENDPRLTDVRNKIALVESLMNFKLQSLLNDEGERHGDAFAVWNKLKAQVKSARVAYKSESYGGLEDALDTIEDIANARLYRYETEAEIKSDIEQWRKLVETEQKINLQGERAIGVESLMLLMAQVLDVIKAVVTDDKQRFTIAMELERLLSFSQSAE